MITVENTKTKLVRIQHIYNIRYVIPFFDLIINYRSQRLNEISNDFYFI